MTTAIDRLISDARARARERTLYGPEDAHNVPVPTPEIDRLVSDAAARRAQPERRPWRRGQFGHFLDTGVAITEAERLTGLR